MKEIRIEADRIKLHDELSTLKRRGKENIGDVDILIASIAYLRNLIVVTRNVTHFGFIQDFIPDLGIDNWAN